MAIPEIREGNAGAVRRRVNEALNERDITCLGVNSKGNGRYRLLFQGKDVDTVRKDDTWVKTHFDRETLYGEQWYPMRVDRAYHGAAVDEMGCSIFGQLNGVKVHKMRWLGNVSVVEGKLCRFQIRHYILWCFHTSDFIVHETEIRPRQLCFDVQVK